MSEIIEIVPDVTGTHAHYYLSRGEEPRGCLVLHDDAGTVQYLFKDGSILECQPGKAPDAAIGDPLYPKGWQTFVTVQGQWQTWRYDPTRQRWTGTVDVSLPSEDRVPLVAVSFDHPDDLVSGGDDEHEADCYISVAPGPGGYYLSVSLDAGHFTAELAEDDGPYESYDAAVQAGRDAAITWFIDNGLPYEGEEPLDEDDAE